MPARVAAAAPAYAPGAKADPASKDDGDKAMYESDEFRMYCYKGECTGV
jgi:hypothetical protein